MLMLNPVVLVRAGTTILKRSASSQNAAADIVVDIFEARLTSDSLDVTARKHRLLRSSLQYDCSFPLPGSSITRVDAGHDLAKAGLGAVVGGLIAGPLGLLAGAAIGGRKRHTLVVAHGDARLVFEATTKDLQHLVARGLLGGEDSPDASGPGDRGDAAPPILRSGPTPTSATSSRKAWLGLAVIVVVGLVMFRVCNKRQGPASADSQASESGQGSASQLPTSAGIASGARQGARAEPKAGAQQRAKGLPSAGPVPSSASSSGPAAPTTARAIATTL